MIEQLTGTVIKRKPPLLVLDVSGVGYSVQMPITAFNDVPAVNEKTTILTHLQVREDAHLLYGFTKETDRILFRELIKISGIGPRIALAVLSAMEGNTFVRYVAERATDKLTSVPGIGKKTAERVLLEMKGRLADIELGDGGSGGASPQAGVSDNISEAVSALKTLGYKHADAQSLVRKTQLGDDASVEDIIRAVLKGSVG